MDELQRSLPHDLGSLLESGKGADVAVEFAGGRVAAHSSVLVARSPVFAAVLQRGQGVVPIPDMPEAVVRQLLAFVYTDAAPQLASVAPQLLALADRFELPVLKRACEEQLAAQLCVENAVPYCVLALRHSGELLRRAAVEYFAQHALQVLGSQGWVQELRRDPRPLVEISRMVASHYALEASVEELQTLLASGVQLNEEKISV